MNEHTSASIKSGDPCPRDSCDGAMVVCNTKVLLEEGVRKRYFHCGTCRCRPENNIQIVPLEFAPPRSG